MKAFFTNAFEYNFSTNLKMNTILAENPTQEEARKLLSHIAHAQEIWLGRMESSERANTPLWDSISHEEIAEKLESNNAGWNSYLSSLSEDDFGKEIEYRSMKGDPFSTKIVDILFHVINHSTHHRAQISTLLRQSGITPAPTDYILFAREK